MQTAVDDRLIRLNPCRIKGAATERSPERAALTVDQVFAVANGMPDRYRALILLATFASMRFGELGALRRQDLDLNRGFVHIKRAVIELGSGRLVVGPPKTAAGRRVVAIPSELLAELEWHLATYVDAAPDALVFAGPKGGPLRRSNFQKSWLQGLGAANLTGVHFHDLRHTGNTLAAQAGATLSDLMTRMGHTSTRAAQIYLHTNSERDRVVARALDPIVKAALSGTYVARGLRLVASSEPGNDENPGFRGTSGWGG